jgi:putative endonuclease
MRKRPCVYIAASRPRGTLYVGVTSRPAQRAWEHREGIIEGFTKRYGVKLLVYYEMHETMEAAIRREKQIKEWKRAWKIRLIESMNPAWRDLYEELGVD